MSSSNFTRRRFLRASVTGAVVAVVAGVGGFLALQQPQPSSSLPVSSPSMPKPATAPQSTAPPATPASLIKPSLLEKASGEGKVTIYTSWDLDTTNQLASKFTQKYPQVQVDVAFRSRGVELMQRFMTEYRAGKHIMDMDCGGVEDTMMALEEGVVDGYVSPETSSLPADLWSREGLWSTALLAPQSIIYNTNLVKGEDIPKTYWDLVKPTFKDRLAVYDARGVPHVLIISKRKIIGEARWLEFLNGLNAQNPKVPVAHASMLKLVTTGEVAVALWAYTGSVTVAIADGAPIEYVRRKGTILATPAPMWISKTAPHPNAARFFLDYILTEEGQKLIADMGKYPPARNGVPSKVGIGIGVGEAVRTEDIARVFPYTREDVERELKVWRDIFRLG